MTVRPSTDNGAQLPARMQARLRAGDPRLYEEHWALVLSMVQAGWTVEQMHRAFSHRKNGGGRWHRRLVHRDGESKAVDDLRTTVAKALRWIAQNPAISDQGSRVEAVQAVRAAADSAPWSGRTGNSDRVVLDALLRLAMRGGGVQFRASQRQLVEMAGVSNRTVIAALGRLQQAGWLRRVEGGRQDRGTTWHVRVPRALLRQYLPPGVVTTGAVTIASLSEHDAFGGGGLICADARVLCVVLNAVEAVTTSALASELGLSAATVRRSLNRLQSAGLLLWSHGEVRSACDVSELSTRLDRLAVHYGTAGRGVLMRERHQREREENDAALAAGRRAKIGVIPGGRTVGEGKRLREQRRQEGKQKRRSA